MGDWSKPALTDAYANFRQYLDDRLNDVIKGNDPLRVTLTNTPTNAIRWNSATNIWETYNGSAWVVLSSLYAVNISGNAATATTAAGVPWSGVTSRPTTLGGYGISDGAPINSPNFTGTPQSNSIELGFRGVPINSQTTGYTLVAGDNGKCISITTGGVTVPNSVMSANNAVTVYNDSGSAQTITQGAGVTLRKAGTATTGNLTLALRGFVTIWFKTASEAIASGNIS